MLSRGTRVLDTSTKYTILWSKIMACEDLVAKLGVELRMMLRDMEFCRYANGDDYKGYFQSGQRFGHGVLQQGRHLSSYASVYVGEWLSDKRHGYGVQDDILKGRPEMSQDLCLC